MKATIVKRDGGLALRLSATDEAERLLLGMFLDRVSGPVRHKLWVPSSGARLGDRGDVVEVYCDIDVAGPEVVFSP